MVFKSSLLKLLDSRGYVNQITNPEGLDFLADSTPITAYIGFDATADSLHIGSLVQIMMLRRLQQTGHRPIIVMGGGTTKIGDPSGKDQSREILSDDRIESNISSIWGIFKKFLDFDDENTGALIINNDEWLNSLDYIKFLREIGPHFTINRMVTFESIKKRLDREQPLTFLEFNYIILQAYDFRELANRHNCQLQLGGSDQWGNIVNGIDLARRMDGIELYGLTTSLLINSNGDKMGKTASGAIWLNEDRLSSYDFWQFWRNVNDQDVGRFLKLFTDIPLDDIARLEALTDQDVNSMKILLANEVTKLCRM